MRFFLISLVILFSHGALAIGVDKDRLADAAQEARAQEIMQQLRCLVCQNQSIVDSDAALAQDLRGIVRELVAAGKREDEILNFMTSRYGDWVLLKPPFKAATALLWLGPVVLLLMGGFIVFRTITGRSKAAPVPLSAQEEDRLKQILDEDSQ